jgi:hypothetical protein
MTKINSEVDFCTQAQMMQPEPVMLLSSLTIDEFVAVR